MENGLRFECQPGCVKCCDTKGYVYLTEENVRNIARHLKMSAADFEAQYVYRTRHLLRLRKPRGSQCHFLKASGCSVHPVKPVQCRLYPFWPELVETRAHWRVEGTKCPGIGKGPLIQIGTAVETANEMRTAYPSTYPKI